MREDGNRFEVCLFPKGQSWLGLAHCRTSGLHDTQMSTDYSRCIVNPSRLAIKSKARIGN